MFVEHYYQSNTQTQILINVKVNMYEICTSYYNGQTP